jgi:hypothetical protein
LEGIRCLVRCTWAIFGLACGREDFEYQLDRVKGLAGETSMGWARWKTIFFSMNIEGSRYIYWPLTTQRGLHTYYLDIFCTNNDLIRAPSWDRFFEIYS